MKILAKLRGKTDLQEMDLFDTDRIPLVWPSAPPPAPVNEPRPFDLWPATDSDNINPKWVAAQSGDYPLPTFMSVDAYGEIGTTQRCYLDGTLYVHGTPTTADPMVAFYISDNWPSPEAEIGPSGVATDTPIERLIPVQIVFEVGSLLSVNIQDMSFDFTTDQASVRFYGAIWTLSDPVIGT